MSRAFVKEDGANDVPRRGLALPAEDDPGYPAAAAFVLLEAAREGDTAGGEAATGFRWGDPALREHMQRMLDQELERPDDERDRRLVQLARRYLREAGRAR